jgi:hypothetical protein
MEREDFAHLLFRIEEMLADVDYWRRQISDCQQCRGWSEEDYGNLCASCLQALSAEFDALKKVAANSEMRGSLRALKEALADDKTGELSLIFKLARKATVN